MNDSAGGSGLRVARTVAATGALACTGSLLLAHVHPFGDASLYGARDAKTQVARSGCTGSGQQHGVPRA
jgi:hypothetical protein